MVVEPSFFRRPDGHSIELGLPPRPASWNARDHEDQRKLSAALDDAEDKLRGYLTEESPSPSTIRLDVGLAGNHRWLSHLDLDNYLFPLARRVTKGRATDLVSAWATKTQEDKSWIRTETAQRAEVPEPGQWQTVRTIRSTTSTQKSSYKQEISDGLRDVAELPSGPVALQLAFLVGSRRNWLNLWKPTIDGLGKLLGQDPAGRQWNPQDGRIAELGLHKSCDPELGNHVIVTVAARSLALALAG